jgi:hypothetical protein
MLQIQASESYAPSWHYFLFPLPVCPMSSAPLPYLTTPPQKLNSFFKVYPQMIPITFYPLDFPSPKNPVCPGFQQLVISKQDTLFFNIKIIVALYLVP